ncbi:cell filamentation protein [Polymorphobacter multimanifer]|jgi:Fic-DOC domain mobile mystery protein B|uniref:Fic-DOC domain mobile mystery protein B n=1 Tax=Polymorphobacter multimanifer TaxID=1070431 RepID=A0A841LKB7_9SPHN|nr:mobile mystery protein B [Polymorphobacter multimanifer]MBB6229418.1 Fic-DOC domain mobile mystery protein B [Polymorphobacter multimanifer]GGI89854.1 cell filamentation protein [Polymorphobacter multimanifer]
MSDQLFDGYDDANTPLEAEEREQLIPSYITLRAELNEAELTNIADARKWLSSRKREVLDSRFLNELHKRMYGDVWKWAGTYRTTARNIGIDAHRIPVELYQAIDNAKYWATDKTFPADEIAVRFSHRVVAIHPYPNGNGRFSRMVGDLLAIELGRPRFSWGQANLVDPSETRKAYIAALKAADAEDFEPLIAFARS